MRHLLALALILILAACGGAQPRIPDGIDCSGDTRIKDVPAKADPESPEYSEAYALGWYIGHGCTTN